MRNEVEYGTLTRRIIAAVVDALLIGLVPFLLLLSFVALSDDTKGIWIGLLWIFYEIFFVQWLLTQVYLIVSFMCFGGSIGKHSMGMQIEMVDGHQPTFFDGFMRFQVGYLVSGVLFGVGYLAISKDPKKQAFHDHIAGTVVVKKTNNNLGAGLLLLLVCAYAALIYYIVMIGSQRNIWKSMGDDAATFFGAVSESAKSKSPASTPSLMNAPNNVSPIQ